MSARRRLTQLLRDQLTQGVSPRDLAFTLALGAGIGILPVLGMTTALCAAVGVALRLNQPLLQLVNYLVYPLQLGLLIPFYRAGEHLLGTAPVPLLSVADLLARFRAGPLQFCLDYARVGLGGVLVWLLVVAPLVAALAWLLRAPLRRLQGEAAP